MQESPKQPPFSREDKPVTRSTPLQNKGQDAPASKSHDGSPPPNIPIEPAQPPVSPPAPPQATPPQPSHVRPQPQPYHPEQKRTLLDRGEVRTMHKDMVRTREEEAKKEQQRITQLKAQQKAESDQEAIAKIRASAQETKQKTEMQKKEHLQRIQSSILPPGEERRVRDLPTPPSQKKKVFVRLAIIIIFAFIILNLVLFAAWFFFFRGQTFSFSFQLPQIPFISQLFSPSPPFQPTPSPLPTPSPQPTPEPSPTPPPESSVNPIQNAVNPNHTTTLQFTEGSDLSSFLAQVLQLEQQPNFTQLLFSQRESDELVSSGSEFFSLFGINLPPGIAPHFSNDSFFFLYSYERGNRFGMIVKTPLPETAHVALKAWESQAEQNLAPVMSFWGIKGPAYTTSWRSTAHLGVEIRFQTFTLRDYGIVYAIVDNYIIFASSHEATKAAIEALQTDSSSTLSPNTLASIQDSDVFKPPPASLSLEQAMGQILMIGFQEADVNQELEDLMKRLRPGGVLLLSKNIKSIEQLRRLTEDLQRISFTYSSLPLFIAVDQEGGAISRIDFGREQTAQSTIQDTELSYQVGKVRAEELKFLGVNLNLSPVLDSTNPGDFLFERTFQAGRMKGGHLAKALLLGQKDAGILSTLKHFPGYGTITFNPEHKLAAVQEFPDISSFVFALGAKPEFLLLSNVIYSSLDPDQPFPFSKKGVSMIRGDLNFEGLILTDDLNQPSLLNNYDLQAIVETPLKAGVTMLMFSKQSYAQEAHETLVRLVAKDPLLEESVKNAATKILKLKKEFFFPPKPSTPFEHLSRR